MTNKYTAATVSTSGPVMKRGSDFFWTRGVELSKATFVHLIEQIMKKAVFLVIAGIDTKTRRASNLIKTNLQG